MQPAFLMLLLTELYSALDVSSSSSSPTLLPIFSPAHDTGTRDIDLGDLEDVGWSAMSTAELRIHQCKRVYEPNMLDVRQIQ